MEFLLFSFQLLTNSWKKHLYHMLFLSDEVCLYFIAASSKKMYEKNGCTYFFIQFFIHLMLEIKDVNPQSERGCTLFIS